MELQGDAFLLKIYIGESDQLKGKALYQEIVMRARDEGMAGATVLHGILSYGASHSIHTLKIFSMSSDLPVLIELVDSREKIEMFSKIVAEMLDESQKGGLVTIEPVEVVRYQKGAKYSQFKSF
jgi:hypothetical protein